MLINKSYDAILVVETCIYRDLDPITIVTDSLKLGFN
jgi:hypothetical protein